MKLFREIMGYLLGGVVFVLLVPWVMMAAGLPLRNENTTSQLQQKRRAAKQNKKRESLRDSLFLCYFGIAYS